VSVFSLTAECRRSQLHERESIQSRVPDTKQHGMQSNKWRPPYADGSRRPWMRGVVHGLVCPLAAGGAYCAQRERQSWALVACAMQLGVSATLHLYDFARPGSLETCRRIDRVCVFSTCGISYGLVGGLCCRLVPWAIPALVWCPCLAGSVHCLRGGTGIRPFVGLIACSGVGITVTWVYACPLLAAWSCLALLAFSAAVMAVFHAQNTPHERVWGGHEWGHAFVLGGMAAIVQASGSQPECIAGL
jgi:hypothetical protein